jgi:hypothetical protein
VAFVLVGLTAFFGCAPIDEMNVPMMPDDEMPPPGLAPGDMLAVSGLVVDFQTGDPVLSASVTTLGLNPVSEGTLTGPEYQLYSPPYSAFHILAGAEPLYMLTVGAPVEVEGRRLEAVPAETMRRAYISLLAGIFGVTPTPGYGIVFVQAVDEEGRPREGLGPDAFELADAPTVQGPYFLADDLGPDPEAYETGARGYFVLFDVPDGAATFIAGPGSGYYVTGTSPTYRDAVTIMKMTVADGGPVDPMAPGEPPPGPVDIGPVDFVTEVMPIFVRNGCIVCHSAGEEGYDRGGLNLTGDPRLVYEELTVEISPNHDEVRTNPAYPAGSLLLTMPSFEDPPDTHPNAIFLDQYDRDYRLLRAWIERGAYYEARD